MQLRNLQAKDAPLMLEWMHDRSVVEHLGANFEQKTLDDCLTFIERAQTVTEHLHLAIVDESDEYMGTVSLKNIGEGCAEFAITIRACAMGKGYSQYAMAQILDYGIHKLSLDAVYWCVAPVNCRAVRFYDKNHYRRASSVPERIRNSYHQELIWYMYR